MVKLYSYCLLYRHISRDGIPPCIVCSYDLIKYIKGCSFKSLQGLCGAVQSDKFKGLILFVCNLIFIRIYIHFFGMVIMNVLWPKGVFCVGYAWPRSTMNTIR